MNINDVSCELLSNILCHTKDPGISSVCQIWNDLTHKEEFLNSQFKGQDLHHYRDVLINKIEPFLTKSDISNFRELTLSAPLFFRLLDATGRSEANWNLIFAFKSLKIKELEYFFSKEFYSYESQANALREVLFNLKDTLSKIKIIKINDAELTLIPSELSLCSGVEELNLSRNAIRSLPNDLSWPKLMELNLNHNQIEEFPAVNLPSLTSISLSYNKLKDLPDNFLADSPLLYLNLNNNQIPSFPINFGNSWRLRGLRLEYNQVAKLPQGWGGAWTNSLKDIQLYENPIQGFDLKKRWPKLITS